MQDKHQQFAKHDEQVTPLPPSRNLMMGAEQHSRAECTVRGALALTLRVSQFAGVAPLRFVRQRDGWRVSVSPAMCVYSYLMIAALHGGIFISLMKSHWKSVRVNTWTEGFVWVTDFINVALIATIGVFRAPTVMNQMIDYLNLINKINIRMNKPHFSGHVEIKKCFFVIGSMIGVFLLNLVNLLSFFNESIDENEMLRELSMHGCYFLEYFITLLLEIQYVLVAFLVNSALVSVNQDLKDLIYIMDLKTKNKLSFIATDNMDITNIPVKQVNSVIDTITTLDNINYSTDLPARLSSKVVQDAIRRLALSYGTICQVVKQVDKCNGVVLLLLLGFCFIHLVVCPYYFISFLTTSQQTNVLFMLQPLYYIFHTISVLMIVEPGQRTQEQMELTGALISQLMQRLTSLRDPLAMELDMFFKQIILNKVSYSPMGICTLSRELLATIFGGVTTYLVILLQFQESVK